MNRIGVNRFGFSLIEVTMAVVVAGILASMSVSTWRRFIAEKHFEETAFKMWKDLSTLRQEALKNDWDYQVSFSGNSYTVMADSDNDGDFDSTDTTFVSHVPERDMPTGVTIENSIDISDKGKNTSNDWSSNDMTINCDAIGSISEGYIYLTSNNPADVVYLMVSEAKDNQIRFRVYKHGSWKDLS